MDPICPDEALDLVLIEPDVKRSCQLAFNPTR